MKRISFKATATVKSVMEAVALKRNKDVADLVYEYFYELAKHDADEFGFDVVADDLLFNTFQEAINL